MTKRQIVVRTVVVLAITIGAYLAYCEFQGKHPSGDVLIPGMLIQLLFAANAYFRK